MRKSKILMFSYRELRQVKRSENEKSEKWPQSFVLNVHIRVLVGSDGIGIRYPYQSIKNVLLTFAYLLRLFV